MRVHVHPAACPGDCCNYDAWVEDLATGEPWDVEYQPPMGHGVSRFLSQQRGSNARPARERRVASPMNARAGRATGLDGRPARATSSTGSRSTLAATGQPPRGDVTAGHHRDTPTGRDPSSWARSAVADGLTEQTRPAGRPSAS